MTIVTIFRLAIASDSTTVWMKVFSSSGVEFDCSVTKVDSIKFYEIDRTEYLRDGALTKASYKVSDTQRVYFSQGNLQFNAMQGTHAVLGEKEEVAGTWRFSENQYDVIGNNNKNISETYDGWIDLFGWGTSGWNSGAKAYQPWSTSQTETDYKPGGSASNDLTGDFSNADWGVYNAISNGGNEPNRWRTLTIREWRYLFQHNKWTLALIKTADEDSIPCFFLIPENFTAPTNIGVSVINTNLDLTATQMYDTIYHSDNTYTIEQFASLEKLGVVALPCGGSRQGVQIYAGGVIYDDELPCHVCRDFKGSYWSSSLPDGYYTTITFTFSENHVSSYIDSGRGDGNSIRLVQDCTTE